MYLGVPGFRKNSLRYNWTIVNLHSKPIGNASENEHSSAVNALYAMRLQVGKTCMIRICTVVFVCLRASETCLGFCDSNKHPRILNTTLLATSLSGLKRFKIKLEKNTSEALSYEWKSIVVNYNKDPCTKHTILGENYAYLLCYTWKWLNPCESVLHKYKYLSTTPLMLKFLLSFTCFKFTADRVFWLYVMIRSQQQPNH